MKLVGTIIAALPLRQGTSSKGAWQSQDFVLEYANGNYTSRMAFTVFGEERLARFAIHQGQYVEVSFDIDAREYNGRWYNDLRAYDVRLSAAHGCGNTAVPNGGYAAADGYPTPTPPPATTRPGDMPPAGDLPF